MDQLQADKSLEFNLPKPSKVTRRFSFAFAKQKVAELLDTSFAQDPISDFDKELVTDELRSAKKSKSGGEVEKKSDTSLIATMFVNASLLLENEEYALASHLFREILVLDPQSLEAASKLVDSLLSSRKWDEAEACCRELLRLQKSARIQKNLADLLYRRGLDEEAKELYFQALNLMSQEGPELFDIYKNLGNISVREGDFEGAEEYYNKAYTLKPGSDILLVNYGTLAVQQGNYDKARERFTQALQVNDKNDRAWVGQALLNEQRGDFELARASVERALDSNPCNVTALELLARWSFRDRSFGSATTALQEYLASVESDPAMSLLLAKLFIVQGQEGLARLELERLLLWQPLHEEALQLYTQVRSHRNA